MQCILHIYITLHNLQVSETITERAKEGNKEGAIFKVTVRCCKSKVSFWSDFVLFCFLVVSSAINPFICWDVICLFNKQCTCNGIIWCTAVSVTWLEDCRPTLSIKLIKWHGFVIWGDHLLSTTSKILDFVWSLSHLVLSCRAFM